MTKTIQEYKLTEQNRKKIENILNKNGIEADVIDIEGFWDNTLTPSENIKNFRKIFQLSKDILDVKIEQEKAQEQLAIIEREEIQRRFESAVEQIKAQNVAELTKYYSNLYYYTETLIKNDKINTLMIIGKRGLGKTFNTIFKLENMGLRYTVVKGHITPLSLYKLLYDNSNCVLILDDIVGLLKDDDVLSMLLGACDYDSKVVKWVSQSPLLNLPSEFVFDGKIIILLNKLDSENEFLNALKDRCYCITLDFTNDEILQMLYILANKRGISYEVVDYLKEMSRASLQNLSLRTLDKVCNLYKSFSHDKTINWQDLAKEMLEYDNTLNTLLEIIEKYHSVSEQIKAFIETTGLSRRTFFRYKAKLNGEFYS